MMCVPSGGGCRGFFLRCFSLANGCISKNRRCNSILTILPSRDGFPISFARVFSCPSDTLFVFTFHMDRIMKTQLIYSVGLLLHIYVLGHFQLNL